MKEVSCLNAKTASKTIPGIPWGDPAGIGPEVVAGALQKNVEARLDRGVMISAGRRQRSVEKGRQDTGRKMPW